MRKFHQLVTGYEDYCREVKKVTPAKFVQIMEDYYKHGGVFDGDKPNIRFEGARLMLEAEWVSTQRPYYNIENNILDPIARMRLDNVSGKLLTVPNKSNVVVLNFPIGFKINNVLVGRMSEHRLFFSISYGKNGFIYFTYRTDVDESIEEIIRLAINELGAAPPVDMILPLSDHQEYTGMAIRAVAMCKFLTDAPDEDLIRFDISSKFKNEWQTATRERKIEIVKRSREHGLNGMNIGLAYHLYAPRLSEPRSTGNGKEQEFAHIRTGHLHAVRYGPNKQHVKIMWFRPIIVNEGKPFKPQE